MVNCRTHCEDGFENCALTKFWSGDISTSEESVPVIMTQIRRLLVDGNAECGTREIKVLHYSIQGRFKEFDHVQVRQLSSAIGCS